MILIMKKNILFFSVSIGAGHNTAASSLEDQFKENIPEIKTEIVDTFNYINPTLSKVVTGSYVETLKFNPRVWGYLYKQAETGEYIVDLGQILSKMLSNKLLHLIEEFQPDVIFCTHAFPAGIMSALKEKTGIKIPVIVVLTDYTIHPFWVYPYIDYYVIPSEQLIYDSLAKGIEPKKIKPLGIPIRKKFNTVLDKREVKRNLCLDERKVVLVMGGGFGLGAVEKTVKILLYNIFDIQIVVITGKNEKLYKRLTKLSAEYSQIKIFGFANNMVEIMTAADIIVTKPGGLTTAEVLSRGIPMVIVDPIPGQEDRNTEFLLNWGVAVKARKHDYLPIVVNQVLNSDLRQRQISEMAAYLAKPNAAGDIVSFAIDSFLK